MSKIKTPHTFIKSKLLLKEINAFHCFSTRTGGVSKGAFKSFNLCFTSGDSRSSVGKNWSIFEKETGISMNEILFPKQAHGDNILLTGKNIFSKNGMNENAGEEGDAVIAQSPGIAVGIMTADCVPVILIDKKNRKGAVIHSGWRGTVLDIAGKTVKKMKDIFGSEPSQLAAAIGPSIRQCCYEVGSDVAMKFKDIFCNKSGIVEEGKNSFFLSLSDAVALQLKEEGLGNSDIEIMDYCTCCEKELFYSYRRDGKETGRQVTVLRL